MLRVLLLHRNKIKWYPDNEIERKRSTFWSYLTGLFSSPGLSPPPRTKRQTSFPQVLFAHVAWGRNGGAREEQASKQLLSQVSIHPLNIMNRLWRSCFSSSNEWTAWKLMLLINTASISRRMSKSKSNATAEGPDVIPIATCQCFPGSDLTLTVMPLSNCAYYLYLEPWLPGLQHTKL